MCNTDASNSDADSEAQLSAGSLRTSGLAVLQVLPISVESVEEELNLGPTSPALANRLRCPCFTSKERQRLPGRLSLLLDISKGSHKCCGSSSKTSLQPEGTFMPPPVSQASAGCCAAPALAFCRIQLRRPTPMRAHSATMLTWMSMVNLGKVESSSNVFTDDLTATPVTQATRTTRALFRTKCTSVSVLLLSSRPLPASKNQTMQKQGK
mmetsp:Transcript_34206/g.79540  ORF Transcript_34206/g.79540 Transcript_34206/m.79540 type:complete len:210 (+) Transcript_34206:1225-1854(+)